MHPVSEYIHTAIRILLKGGQHTFEDITNKHREHLTPLWDIERGLEEWATQLGPFIQARDIYLRHHERTEEESFGVFKPPIHVYSYVNQAGSFALEWEPNGWHTSQTRYFETAGGYHVPNRLVHVRRFNVVRFSDEIFLIEDIRTELLQATKALQDLIVCSLEQFATVTIRRDVFDQESPGRKTR